jgi:tetratricopeptide (TPR) repeat protein
VTLVVSFLVSLSFAQPKKEALDHAREGYEYEQQGKYAEALYKYNQSIAADTKYPYPVQRIAAMYQKLRTYGKAIEFYRRSIALDSSFDDYNYYNLALSYRTLRKFDSAAMAYELFANRMKPILQEDSATLRKALSFISYTEQSRSIRAREKNTFEPIPLDAVNSPYFEFGPAVTLDGKRL